MAVRPGKLTGSWSFAERNRNQQNCTRIRPKITAVLHSRFIASITLDKVARESFVTGSFLQ